MAPESADRDSLVRPIEMDETASETIVLAVAEATGKPPVQLGGDGLDELDALYNQVDPHAIDMLFRGDDAEGNVVFYWEGCEIEMDSGTHVIVTELE